MPDKVDENPYFQTTLEAVRSLQAMLPQDIWRSQFQGPYWQLIMSQAEDSLDIMITTVIGTCSVRELFATYLRNIVVPNLVSMVEEGATYDPDTLAIIELDDAKMIEMAALIPKMQAFVEGLQTQNGAPMQIAAFEGEPQDLNEMTVCATIGGQQRIIRFKAQVVVDQASGGTLYFTGIHNERAFVSGFANPDSRRGVINVLDNPPLNSGEFLHVVWSRRLNDFGIDTFIDRQNAVGEQLHRLRSLLVAHLRPNETLVLAGEEIDEVTPVASTLWFFNHPNRSGWEGATIGEDRIRTQLIR